LAVFICRLGSTMDRGSERLLLVVCNGRRHT
jgi:hypothetical protein